MAELSVTFEFGITSGTVNHTEEKDNQTVTIFIVDDSELFQYYLKGYLKNHLSQKAKRGITTGLPLKPDSKVRVFQFLNGSDAVKNFWRKPDVLILDYYLDADVDGQNRNGDWVFEQFKTNSPQTKIVMVSEATDPQVIVKMIKLGLEHFVIKDLNHLTELGQYL
jgi:DNA-binding NarL/FixJ family response regulator